MSTDIPGYVSCSFRLPAAAQQPIQTCVVDLLYGLPESGVHCTPTRHNQTHKLKGQKCHLPEVLYANTVFDVRIFMGPIIQCKTYDLTLIQSAYTPVLNEALALI